MFPPVHMYLYSDTSKEDRLRFNDSLEVELKDAILCGKAKVVEAILGATARFEDISVNVGVSLLLDTILSGDDADCLNALLHHGLDPNSGFEPEFVDHSALTLAAFEGRAGCVNKLVEFGADVDMLVSGKSALFWATSERRTECMRVLLSHGADPNLLNGTGTFVPLLFADVDAAQLLVEHGADVDAVDADGRSALYFAVQDYDFELASFLLNEGANPNVYTSRSTTPLMRAAIREADEFVLLLLDNGADVEARNRDEETALFVASRSKNSRSIKFLLEAGAKVHARDKVGGTPLHYITCTYSAVYDESDSDNDSDNVSDDEDDTYHDDDDEFDTRSMLMVDCINTLISHGADPNATDDRGQTPLTRPLQKDEHQVVEALIQSGATNPGLVDSKMSAFRFADERGFTAAALFRATVIKSRIRKLRGIIRLIVVFSRYREEFYRHKYVNIGAHSFANGQRLLLDSTPGDFVAKV